LAAILWLVSGFASAQGPEWLYTVRPGDSIWTITDRYLVSMRYWQDLQRLNNVADPQRLAPGSRLRVPVAWLAAQPVPVLLVTASGEVVAELLLEGGRERVVVAGERLHAGDRLLTADDGNAVLQFADGSRLFVRGNSEVALDTVSAYGDSGMTDTRVRLQKGRVDTQARPAQGPATRFQIETPAAVSAVRGTEYRVGVTVSGERAVTEVLTGSVGVSGSGVSRSVAAGFGTVTQRGSAPEKPRPLLAAPELGEMVAILDRIPFQVAWPPVEGASAYRIQIAAEQDFETLLEDRVGTTARFLGPDLADGDYWIRVRAIDGADIEGLSAVAPLTLDARPVAPIIVTPQPDATVREAQPRMSWSQPEGINRYRLQIARDEAFQRRVTDPDDLKGASFRPEVPLEPGLYHWRLASIGSDGEIGPFGDASTFTYRPVPASPGVEAPAVEGSEVVFRWNAGVPGQQYHFQLARDTGFDPPLVDRMLHEPSFQLDYPQPGIYYVRVAIIDVDGYVGPFGPPQKVSIPVTSKLPAILMILFGALML
jgi:hypothetical protein